MKLHKTTIVIILIAIVAIIAGYLYYQKANGPLPYEQGYDEIYAEQGLPGIDYEYTGPNSENPPTAPDLILPKQSN